MSYTIHNYPSGAIQAKIKYGRKSKDYTTSGDHSKNNITYGDHSKNNTTSGDHSKNDPINSEDVMDAAGFCLNGESLYYHENGNLARKENWKQGKMEGIQEIFYPNGSKEAIISIFSGNVEGEQKEWYLNGSIKSDSYISTNDKEFYREWYSDGKDKMFCRYVDGVEKCERWFENKQLQSLMYYVNKQLDGTVLEFYPDGTVFKRFEMKNGKRNGKYEEFYHNGQIKIESYWDNGISCSKTKGWQEDGSSHKSLIIQKLENGDVHISN